MKKIHQDYGKALMVETIQMMLDKPNNMEKIWYIYIYTESNM